LKRKKIPNGGVGALRRPMSVKKAWVERIKSWTACSGVCTARIIRHPTKLRIKVKPKVGKKK